MKGATTVAENKRIDSTDKRALLARLRDLLSTQGINADSLVGETEMPAFDKFDPYIPAELLRRAYVADRLNPEEVIDRFLHDFVFRGEGS